jgi:transglutaminase-like putative cysteine protease
MESPGMKSSHLNFNFLVSRGFKKIGTGAILALLLLFFSMGSTAYGMTLVVRGLSFIFAIGLATSGLLAGWLLARSPLSAWRSGVLGFSFGLALLVVHLGHLEANLFGLLQQSNVLLLSFFQGPGGRSLFLENLQNTGVTLGNILEKLAVLFDRLVVYFTALSSGNPAFDPIASLILWGIALWMASFWAAWMIRREGKPLLALLPGGVLLSASLSYSRGDPTILLLYLAAALLLILLSEHQALQQGWDAKKTDYSEELGIDIAMLAVPLVAIILAAASFSPNISPRRINQLVQEVIRQPQSQIRELSESLGLQGPPANLDRLENQRSPGMPRQHLIGSGPELSERVVMEVRTLEIGELKDNDDLPDEPAARLNYWRWLTYDTYTGSGWSTGRPEIVSYRAGELARPSGDAGPVSALPNQLPLTQEIEVLRPAEGALYAVGTVVTTDTNYQLAWRPFSESAGVDIFGGSVESSKYRVRSYVSILIESQLRSSGSIYPVEIRSRYLSLPDTLPQNVHALALELTATLPTAYERARAIESYIRNIPYSVEVPLPGRGIDIIDFYLFDLKRGYCDYAASAMVVLARAAGIPARLVTGYAGGNYDPDRGTVVVTEADAHSWAELYFPGSGWIEFEATGGRPGLETAPESVPPMQSLVDKEPFPAPAARPGVWDLWLILGLFSAALILFLAGLQIADHWRLGRMTPEHTVLLLYKRFQYSGAQLTSSSPRAHTPNEFAARFTHWMEGLAASNKVGSRLAVRPREINQLTELYNRTVYSSQKPGKSEQETAIHVWNRIRWRLWLLRLSPWSISQSQAREKNVR